MKGSTTGRFDVTFTTAPLPRFSTLKRRSVRPPANSTPACLKASCEARRADMPANSAREALTSTSARNGCPKPDSTVIFPRPAASATQGANERQVATATAAARFLNWV